MSGSVLMLGMSSHLIIPKPIGHILLSLIYLCINGYIEMSSNVPEVTQGVGDRAAT